MLEPEYSEQAATMLDKIEGDESRRPLWNAICDAVDLVCDHPESREARRERLQVFKAGVVVWRVPIRCPAEVQDWTLLWQRDDNTAIIAYIGPYERPV